MEALETVSLVAILIAAVVLGAVWTTTVLHWLRTTRTIR
jgi:hypothetical protein